jgi:cellulose synthase/poly-beta-1,6-N-acetylglucosamine synthase-like glycosyltransferase
MISSPPLELCLIFLFWTSLSLLFYSHLGYPLLLSAWARLGRHLVLKADCSPSVCLVIAAHNEAATITTKLENVLALEYPRDILDVIVVSDGSTDRTDRLVRSYADRGVRLITYQPWAGKAHAVNTGVASAQAEVVAFTDANVYLESRALRNLVRSFADSTVGAVCGEVVIIPAGAKSPAWEGAKFRLDRLVRRGQSDVGSMVGADGAFYALRRRLFHPLREDSIADDLMVPMQAVQEGYRVVYDPEARGTEKTVDTSAREFRRKARVIAGNLQALPRLRWAFDPFRHGNVCVHLLSWKMLKPLAPLFLACCLATSYMLADISLYRILLWAQLAFYSAAVLGRLTDRSPRLRRMRVFSLAYYCCAVWGACVVASWSLLLGWQTVKWSRER